MGSSQGGFTTCPAPKTGWHGLLVPPNEEADASLPRGLVVFVCPPLPPALDSLLLPRSVRLVSPINEKKQRHRHRQRTRFPSFSYLLPIASSTASTTCSTTRSMSRALRAGNGRLKPRRSTTARPFTATTKFPLAGLSLLTSTTAFGRRWRRAASILAALVLNAPHDLHASIDTSTGPIPAAVAEV